jgi:hypothetical protein
VRNYSSEITLSHNSRDLYSLDPTMGCRAGLAENPLGCYNDCFAARSAMIRGYDFTKTTLRHFRDRRHEREILNKIRKMKQPFVRMGTNGDPSEDWTHTLNICRIVAPARKPIVIITRHWTALTDEQLSELSRYNICINTSVSALDNVALRERCLAEYERLKPFCKSVLRIVSCDFNLENKVGRELAEVQRRLFENDNTLDTVFRVSPRNEWSELGIVNTKKERFLGAECLVSRRSSETYFGKCGTCKELCGADTLPKVLHRPQGVLALR